MALLIIGTVLLYLSLVLALLWREDGWASVGVTGICAMLFIVGFGLMLYGASDIAFKAAIDGENPYHKEYVYRDMPDGTKVLTDSVYVRE